MVLVTSVRRWSHPDIELIEVETAAEMGEAIGSRSAGCDAVIMAAAVADFRPATVSAIKIKKADSGTGGGLARVELERTTDILAGLGARKPEGQILVGFAAETNDVITNAQSKLIRKNLDLIVANDVSPDGVGFGHDTNRVTIIGRDGISTEVPMAAKASIAVSVVDRLSGLLRPDGGEDHSETSIK